jgi:hypothetical protein
MIFMPYICFLTYTPSVLRMHITIATRKLSVLRPANGLYNCWYLNFLTFRRLIMCIRIAALLYSVTQCRKILLHSFMVV